MRLLRRSSMTRRLIVALVALVAALVAPTGAIAATAANELTLIQATGAQGQPTEDAWFNYDFTEPVISRLNVDWAWSLVFAPWASINRVKYQSALSLDYRCGVCSPIALRRGSLGAIGGVGVSWASAGVG